MTVSRPDAPAQPGDRHRFRQGFFLPLSAAQLLLKNRGIKRYAILPLLVNAFVYTVAILVFTGFVLRWDLPQPEWTFWGGFGSYLAWMVNALAESVKVLLLVPIAFVVAYFTFTSVGMVIASPFNDLLSERVEMAICQPQDAQSMPVRVAARAMVLSAIDSLGIVIEEIGVTILALPLLLIPVIGAVPLFLVSAYFAGLGFVDASMARHLLRHKHKKLFIRENRWQILGLGVAMQALFLIPLVGLMLLPVAVTAGTILYCRFDWQGAMQKVDIEPPEGYLPPTPREPTAT